MNLLKTLLEKQKIIVLDGASGTELQRKGYDVNDELWAAMFLISNPKAIKEVHEDYLQAGANCITSLSYQATYEGFYKKGLNENEAKKMLLLSVSLAKEARDEYFNKNSEHTNKALVAASIGPYGAFLADGSEFRGDYSLNQKELEEFHKKRLDTLLEAKPDLLAFETVPCLKEAKAYVNLLKNKKNINAWISFSAKDSLHINSGETIKECAQYLEEYSFITAIGINCTSPKYAQSLIKEIKKVSSKIILVYANSGDIYDANDKSWKTSKNNISYAKMSEAWYKAGARIIGGCCQTTPKDIKEIVNIYNQGK